ncbi:MAG: DUF6455 family protein [Pseudoruegeria sp.]
MNKTFRRHAALVDHMAETLGVDLEEQVFRGNIGINDIGDAVLNCTGCTQADDCDHWLAKQKGVSERTPAYCRNSEMFVALKG